MLASLIVPYLGQAPDALVDVVEPAMLWGQDWIVREGVAGQIASVASGDDLGRGLTGLQGGLSTSDSTFSQFGVSFDQLLEFFDVAPMSGGTYCFQVGDRSRWIGNKQRTSRCECAYGGLSIFIP